MRLQRQKRVHRDGYAEHLAPQPFPRALGVCGTSSIGRAGSAARQETMEQQRSSGREGGAPLTGNPSTEASRRLTARPALVLAQHRAEGAQGVRGAGWRRLSPAPRQWGWLSWWWKVECASTYKQSSFLLARLSQPALSPRVFSASLLASIQYRDTDSF